MSVWSTRSFDRVREYVVVRHTLPSINCMIKGIKFRNGFAVVEKDSKTYFELKKTSLLKGSKEFPISFLKKLPFITRTNDIKTVYGADVYRYFINIEQEQKNKVLENTEVATLAPVVEIPYCKFKTPSNEVCNTDKATESPSGYCRKHLLNDPRLSEFGIEVPEIMTKQEKKDFRRKISEKLYKLKQEGKF